MACFWQGMKRVDEDCDLCAKDDGNYDFGRVCCCARYIASLPLVRLRRGWMERLKARKSAEFYTAIERAVTVRWEKTKGNEN